MLLIDDKMIDQKKKTIKVRRTSEPSPFVVTRGDIFFFFANISVNF